MMRQGPPGGGRRGGGGRGRFHGGNGGGHGGGGQNRNYQPRGGNGNGNISSDQPRSAASLRHQTFDSNGPDVRVRGNAWQVHEKYQALARDATSSGDKIAAENYLQHAEHYYRIIQAINEATASEQRARGVGTTQPEAFMAPQGGGEGQVEVRGPAGYVPQGQPPQQQGTQQQQTQQAQPGGGAEVVRQQQSPFYQPEEAEEDGSGPTQLVANR